MSAPANDQKQKQQAHKRLMLNLPDVKNAPFHERIRMALQDEIATGRLKAGDRLPTVKQLSEELNIAYATVSRAVRSLVKDGLLEAHSGRGIHVPHRRTSRLGSIGLLVYAPYRHVVATSQYFSRMMHLLQDRLVERGQMAVYANWSADTRPEEMFNGLQMVDGVVVLGIHHRQLDEFESLPRMGVPAVAIGAHIDHDWISGIDSDATSDLGRAVHTLIQTGCKRIVLLVSDQQTEASVHTPRVDAFRQAMEEHGIANSDDLIIAAHPSDWAARLLKMESAPDAAILTNVSYFESFFDSLRGSQLEPGNAMAICAYDENLWRTISPYGIDHLRIDQPLQGIADAAVDELLSLLSDASKKPRQILLPSTVLSVGAQGDVRPIAAAH